MKHQLTLLLIILFALFCIKKATGQIKFNADEEYFASAFVDPTFSDKGFQSEYHILWNPTLFIANTHYRITTP